MKLIIETVYQMQDQMGLIEMRADQHRVHIRRPEAHPFNHFCSSPNTRQEALDLAASFAGLHNALVDMADTLPDDQDPMENF